MITTDTIITALKGYVENKQPVSSHVWTEAAQKLNVLIGDEHDKLFNLMQVVAKKKVELIQAGDTVAKAKTFIEATDEYREMKKQAARIEQIEEFIRIAKIQARLKDNEYQNQ